MGFVAVLRDPGTSFDSFQVNECHINLWVLNGLLGRRNFVWDVGLRIHSNADPFSKIQIALPSGIPDGGMTDLRDRLLNARVDELIFGQPVDISKEDTINYGKGPLLLSKVPPSQAKIDHTISDSRFTLWSLELATPVAPNSDTYLRIRFRSNSIGRVWSWKWFLFSRPAALVDIRFSDIREAWNVRDGESLKNRIVPIEALHFFLVVSSSLHMVSASPPVHYIRILEGKAWQPYLGRRVSVLGSEKLSIYQWRNKAGEPVSTEKPLRVYIDLEKQLGALSVLNLLTFLLTAFLVCTLAVLTTSSIARGVLTMAPLVCDFVRRHVAGLSVGAVFVVFSKFLTQLDVAQKCLRWANDKLGVIESALFRAG